jgi:hypothetical protein
VKSRGTFSAPAFHAEGALTGITSATPTTKEHGVSGSAEQALFFIDELGEG